MNKSSLCLIIGICICVFIFYRIFLINPTPYTIDTSITFIKRLCILGVLLSALLFAGYYAILLITTISNKGYFKQLIYKVLNYLVYTPLEVVGNLLLRSNLIELIIKMQSNMLYTMIYNKFTLYLFIVVCYICPRILFCVCLYIDIYLLQKMIISLAFVVNFSFPLIIRVFTEYIKLYASNKLNILMQNSISIEVITNHVIVNPKTAPITEAILKEGAYYYHLIDIVYSLKVCLQSKYVMFIFILYFLTIAVLWNHYLSIISIR
jgi:hypothetical protein